MMKLFSRYSKTTTGVFQLLRRDAHLVLKRCSPRVLVLGSGAKSDGKSAILIKPFHNFLINCPETTAVAASFVGMGTSLKSLLLTRPHWNNIAGLLNLLHNFFVDQGREKFRVFGIEKPKICIPAPTMPRKLVEFVPIGIEVKQSGITVRSFQLAGGPGCQPTIAYHLLVTEDDQATNSQSAQKPSSILVLEVLNEAQIKNFLTNPRLAASLRADPPQVALHFSERHLQDNAAFQSLVDGLPASCQHIFFDAERPSYLEPVWMRRHIVRHFFQNRRTYPLPPRLRSSLTEAAPGEVWRDLTSKDWDRLSVHFDEMRQWLYDGVMTHNHLAKFPGGIHKLRPHLRPDATPTPAPIGRPNCWSAHSLLSFDIEEGAWSNVLDLTCDASRLLASILAKNFHCEINDVRRRSEEVGRRIQQELESGDLPPIRSEYPKVTFLGTGSAVPVQHRNVTGIVLRVDEENSIIIDCGSGTLSRMYTLLGDEGTHEILRTVKAVCISHDHSDHCEGLLLLLMEWTKVNSDSSKLFIMANKFVFEHINHSITHFCPTLDLSRFGLYELRRPGKMPLHSIDGVEVEFVCVRHKLLSFGFSFRHVDGWHVVFSGDTMPSKNLVRVGHNCDLLIHEATHEDHMEDEAFRGKHSTISQAISVARQMNAKRVVLTHFSQRSVKFPVSLTAVPDHFVLASDGLQLALDDVYYFRGDQVKTLANFLTFSFSIGNYQFFSETPTFSHPPRLSDEQKGGGKGMTIGNQA